MGRLDRTGATRPVVVNKLGRPVTSSRSVMVSLRRYDYSRYTRCQRCGRPRSVYRKFGLCRICLREMALGGQLPGVSKSSW